MLVKKYPPIASRHRSQPSVSVINCKAFEQTLLKSCSCQVYFVKVHRLFLHHSCDDLQSSILMGERGVRINNQQFQLQNRINKHTFTLPEDIRAFAGISAFNICVLLELLDASASRLSRMAKLVTIALRAATCSTSSTNVLFTLIVDSVLNEGTLVDGDCSLSCVSEADGE